MPTYITLYHKVNECATRTAARSRHALQPRIPGSRWPAVSQFRRARPAPARPHRATRRCGLRSSLAAAQPDADRNTHCSLAPYRQRLAARSQVSQFSARRLTRCSLDRSGFDREGPCGSAAQRKGVCFELANSFPSRSIWGVNSRKVRPPSPAGRAAPIWAAAIEAAKLRGCCELSCRAARRAQLHCEQNA